MAELKERKAPKFVEFAEGEVVEGILIGASPIEVIADQQSGRKSKTIKYTVEDRDGERYAFLGTYDINQKLSPADLGREISVRYEGEDKNVVRNGRSMKMFRVYVSDEKVASTDRLMITNDDVPF